MSSDFIPLSVPMVGEGELENLRQCIETGWVSSAGPFVTEFENRIAAYVGSPHGVAATSGTAALHLALIVAGVCPGDEVLVSTLSFVAPANAIRYIGAHPVFVDADPETWQMSPSLVGSFLREKCGRREGALINKETGRRVSAILPVHILGGAVDMDRILALAKEFGLSVIEDATEGLGATYRGRPLGTMGDIGCFSFNGNKLITCGGGGMIVTQNKHMADRARHLSTQAKSDPAEYDHDEVGFNYRLTNIQAALGCAQLDKIDDYLDRKAAIASAYLDEFKDNVGISPMPRPDWSDAPPWLFAIDLASGDSRDVIAAAKKAGIEMRPLWKPLHRTQAHQGSTVIGGAVAEGLFERVVCLPSSVGISGGETSRVAKFLKGALS